MIAWSRRPVHVLRSRGGEERVEFVFVEERDDRLLGAFGWDREHAGDQRGVFGVA